MNTSDEIIRNLLNKKFGDKYQAKIVGLVNKLINEDVLIGGKANSYLENLLSVKEKDIDKTLTFLLDISNTSYFAAAFFIEKIPLLYFYDLFYDYITLLSLTRHYSSRSLAYVLGSSDLKSNDLELNVRTISIKRYKEIIAIIIEKHKELEILSLHIARHIGKIFSVIEDKDIIVFFDICSNIKSLYGKHCAIAYLDNIQSFLEYIPLREVMGNFERMHLISNEYLLFAISYPEVIKAKKTNKKTYKNLTKLKIDIFKNDDYALINNFPELLHDEYFLALLMSWKKYPLFHKENIIQQFNSDDYKKELLTNKDICNEVDGINRITNNNWFKNWSFAGAQIDNQFIYEEIRKILLPSCYFQHNTKSIYNEQKATFQKIKLEPETELVIFLIDYLISICINDNIKDYLHELKNYLNTPTHLFLKKYSKNGLFIKTWDRDPWIDYARSDELYACTSIGEATDLYATSYLADINNNNLDIYNNEMRIGRMHFFLVKDISDNVIILFDCIDGSDRLMRNETRLNYLLESIKTYATFVKIDRIIFNSDLMFNNTPKLFIKFLKSKLKDEQNIFIKRYIENESQKKVMLFPLPSFTEALKDKNEGIVRGFVVNTKS